MDGFFRFGQDVLGFRRHVFCAKGEFENHNGGGTFDTMKDHPPEGTAVENCVVGFFGDESENGASGRDASICGDVVKVIGVRGLVHDAAVEAAEAGAVDDSAGAVGEDRQGDTVGFGFGVLGWIIKVEGFGKGGIELQNFTVELFDTTLDFGPFHMSNLGAVESG